jgi:hypothetical protein
MTLTIFPEAMGRNLKILKQYCQDPISPLTARENLSKKFAAVSEIDVYPLGTSDVQNGRFFVKTNLDNTSERIFPISNLSWDGQGTTTCKNFRPRPLPVLSPGGPKVQTSAPPHGAN